METATVNDAVHRLRVQIEAIEAVLHGLKTDLARAEQNQMAAPANKKQRTNSPFETDTSYKICSWQKDQIQREKTPRLDAEEYKRYGRQMIVPEVGIDGQLALRSGSVLVVGVGGLGCPAAMYLAGSGVGKIGLVDGDLVETSNLHRQILHSTETMGLPKVQSARLRLKGINPKVQCVAYDFYLTPHNVFDLFKQYDIILDCTDHPASRYLISDAAVLASKPLVTASALKAEGQLMVLNYPIKSSIKDSIQRQNPGQCYRCVFPRPPPAESVTTCGEGGILGPAVGCMGVLMATETIKLLMDLWLHENSNVREGWFKKPTMLIYSAFSDQPFRTIRLLGRRKDCPSCSDNATITEQSIRSGSLDYTAFCGARPPPNVLPVDQQVTASEYRDIRSAGATPHILIDVREETQFGLAYLRNSFNIPLYNIQTESWESIKWDLTDNHTWPVGVEGVPIYFICRFGNDSRLAVQHFRQKAPAGVQAYDVRGGLDAWRKEVDPGFPEY